MSKTGINNVKQVAQRSRAANVLIVDNNAELIRFMLEILARKGIHGIIANDKKAAVDLLDKGNYDLVFTSDKISRRSDLSGQSQGGFELLRKIRANSPELPVVMVTSDERRTTSNELIETAVKAIRAGCCDFLIKPLRREKIEGMLDTFLPNHSVSTIASAQEDIRCLYQIVGRSEKLVQTVNLAKK